MDPDDRAMVLLQHAPSLERSIFWPLYGKFAMNRSLLVISLSLLVYSTNALASDNSEMLDPAMDRLISTAASHISQRSSNPNWKSKFRVTIQEIFWELDGIGGDDHTRPGYLSAGRMERIAKVLIDAHNVDGVGDKLLGRDDNASYLWTDILDHLSKINSADWNKLAGRIGEAYQLEITAEVIQEPEPKRTTVQQMNELSLQAQQSLARNSKDVMRPNLGLTGASRTSEQLEGIIDKLRGPYQYELQKICNRQEAPATLDLRNLPLRFDETCRNALDKVLGWIKESKDLVYVKLDISRFGEQESEALAAALANRQRMNLAHLEITNRFAHLEYQQRASLKTWFFQESRKLKIQRLRVNGRAITIRQGSGEWVDGKDAFGEALNQREQTKKRTHRNQRRRRPRR